MGKRPAVLCAGGLLEVLTSQGQLYPGWAETSCCFCVGVDSSVDPISLLAEYTVLLRILVEVEGQQELLEIEGELDGMESSKSKSDAHFMHG